MTINWRTSAEYSGIIDPVFSPKAESTGEGLASTHASPERSSEPHDDIVRTSVSFPKRNPSQAQKDHYLSESPKIVKSSDHRVESGNDKPTCREIQIISCGKTNVRCLLKKAFQGPACLNTTQAWDVNVSTPLIEVEDTDRHCSDLLLSNRALRDLFKDAYASVAQVVPYRRRVLRSEASNFGQHIRQKHVDGKSGARKGIADHNQGSDLLIPAQYAEADWAA